MRASQCVVLAVGMLFQGMRARLDSQGVAPWVHPQVARITLHSDVELVDVQTGHTRTIYRRSVWCTRRRPGTSRFAGMMARGMKLSELHTRAFLSRTTASSTSPIQANLGILQECSIRARTLRSLSQICRRPELLIDGSQVAVATS